MIYKLLHTLFGWDYIAWSNPVNQGIARLHKDGTGQVFYWRYKTIHVSERLLYKDQVLWLTCSPDKWGVK